VTTESDVRRASAHRQTRRLTAVAALDGPIHDLAIVGGVGRRRQFTSSVLH
jgi:hypothetical protein